jgi:acetylornithine deacetylase/succinyl-diaminopimelate desuccinylase-like protein
MVPGQRIQDVHQEFTGLIRSLNAKDPSPGAKVESFCTIPPSAVPEDAHSVQSIKRAHETVVGEPPKPVQKTHYNDSDHMNRYGIEVVVYGPAGRMRSREFGWAPNLGEFVHIPDLVTASKVYALAALDLCAQDRDPKALRPDPFAAV